MKLGQVLHSVGGGEIYGSGIGFLLDRAQCFLDGY